MLALCGWGHTKKVFVITMESIYKFQVIDPYFIYALPGCGTVL
jgi:hypothetical protein